MDIVQVIVKGHLPLKRKLRENEVKRYIRQSKYSWSMVNERSPRLSTTLQRKKKKVLIQVMFDGNIMLFGVHSIEEANAYYKRLLLDFKRLFDELVIEA